MRKPEIVPALKYHFDDLGEKVRRSGRAIAVVLVGKTIGIGGYYFDSGRVVVYSTITPELRVYRKTIVRGANIVMGMIESVKAPADAVAAEVPGADNLLEHFGFERLGRTPTWRRQVH